LAGGRGERFWPMSQPQFPKQFLSVFRNRSLIVQTMDRVSTYFRRNERILIIPEELRKLTLKYIGKERTIIEPMRRNTAPAICLAAMILQKEHADGILHVMPADHLISLQRNFIATLKVGEDLAAHGYLVTYGINPDRPETGYGYVKIGHRISIRNKIMAFKGEGFTEKPSLARAKKYIKSKKYLWNSGIFSFRIKNILEEIEQFIPEVCSGVAQFVKTRKKKFFQRIPDISIDYGVMERSRNLCIVKGNFIWDDVGSWLALERYFKKDAHGNILIGDTTCLETSESIMYTHGVPLKTFGIEGLIIVVSPYGVLVCKKERAPHLKNLLRIKK
jgi:mannose-1-phosphate guanylyltransferase